MTFSRRYVLKAMAASATISSPALSFLLGGCGGSNNTVQPIESLPSPMAPGPVSDNPHFTDLMGFDYPVIDELLPFAHGVASGDPLSDRVILWTRITIPDIRGNVSDPQGFTEADVNWLIASDPEMTNIINGGTMKTDASRDWTVKIDASGLNPATTYYYAFGAFGKTSIIGRTRTAPAANQMANELRLAVVSCSSYWSSQWSGYKNLALRNDLDLVVHLGDYIYDFVDQDEEVRARIDRNGVIRNQITDVDYRSWLNVNEVRRRYALYRSDPNLLLAHQQHPWTIIWDNHDIEFTPGNELNDSAVDMSDRTTTLDQTCSTFWEWTPCRPPKDLTGAPLTVDKNTYPAPINPRQLWRKLPYGQLADIICTDIELHRQESDEERAANFSDHLAAGDSLLGKDQYEFITQTMLQSKEMSTKWRIIPHQTWLSPWNIPTVIDGVAVPTPIATRWENFQEERAQWFQFLRDNSIDNNMTLAGDMHGNWAADLVEDNSLINSYINSPLVLSNPRTGSTVENQLAGFGRISPEGIGRTSSVGVEFAPSSMGRGGADELVANATGNSSTPANVAGARAIELATIEGNKNVQFMEWVDHGYGIVHITPAETIFEFWWQDKLTVNAPDVLGYQMIAFAEDDMAAVPPRFKNQINNIQLYRPSADLNATSGQRQDAPAPVDKDYVQS